MYFLHSLLSDEIRTGSTYQTNLSDSCVGGLMLFYKDENRLLETRFLQLMLNFLVSFKHRKKTANASNMHPASKFRRALIARRVSVASFVYEIKSRNCN